MIINYLRRRFNADLLNPLPGSNNDTFFPHLFMTQLDKAVWFCCSLTLQNQDPARKMTVPPVAGWVWLRRDDKYKGHSRGAPPRPVTKRTCCVHRKIKETNKSQLRPPQACSQRSSFHRSDRRNRVSHQFISRKIFTSPRKLRKHSTTAHGWIRSRRGVLLIDKNSNS